ncbi:uncharacterized protein LOC108682487 [Hyalella azteca]|uniref:Uncharacterized protein LOC108682487 n=1 Tax=Hyalella azteca TaxID=294128 RepID=A0A8B7PMC3_HYAAZ|nr:uncharacterized protein LOC108682487 [Hyalella azteca]
MGGAVSASKSNDDMVTKLINAQYIKTPCIERAFRAVDRGNYVLNKEDAYSDNAWWTQNLHLSAPCIYAQVLEGLLLEPGKSFLNIGSGTGYLSTMVATIIGNEGSNHGVELRPDVILYAHARLKAFKKSGSYDPDFFAEPVFVEGNAYKLIPPATKYDRIYCGASVEISFLDKLRDDFLNIGGVMVAPVQNELLQVYKESKDRDIVTSLLDVSFSDLVKRTAPNPKNPHSIPNSVTLPVQTVQSLQEQCRARIIRLVKAKLLEEKRTRGGIFARAFSSENCPPVPTPYTLHPPNRLEPHNLGGKELSSDVQMSGLMSPNAPPMQPTEEVPENENQMRANGTSTHNLLRRSQMATPFTDNDSKSLQDSVEIPSTMSSERVDGPSNRARVSSTRSMSDVDLLSFGYRRDAKVIRVCGKTLLASHSSPAVKRCGPPIQKHPPFMFGRFITNFSNIDESDVDDDATVGTRYPVENDDAHSSSSASSLEDYDSTDEAIKRHRNIKAFNSLRKSTVASSSALPEASLSSTGGSTSHTQTRLEAATSSMETETHEVTNGESNCKTNPNHESEPGEDSTMTNSSNSEAVRFLIDVWENPLTDDASSALHSSRDGKDKKLSPAADDTERSERSGSNEATPVEILPGASGINYSSLVVNNAHENDIDDPTNRGIRNETSLPREASEKQHEEHSGSCNGSIEKTTSRSDDNIPSDDDQSSDSIKSTGDSCARTKAVKRQSVEDPMGRSGRCKRGNRHNSSRSQGPSVAGSTMHETQSHQSSVFRASIYRCEPNSTASHGARRFPVSFNSSPATNRHDNSSLLPGFLMGLRRLDTNNEREPSRSIAPRTRARQLSVARIALLARLPSSVEPQARDRNQTLEDQHEEARRPRVPDDGEEMEVDAREGADAEEELTDEESEDDASDLSDFPSVDEFEEERFLYTNNSLGGARYYASEKNYVSSSDEEPEYFQDHFRKASNANCTAPDMQAQQPPPRDQAPKRSRMRTGPHRPPPLWVRGTDGFDSYLDYRNSQLPFPRLPREFRLEIRILDRLQRLPLPPPIRDHLLLGNWTSIQRKVAHAQVPIDESEEMEVLMV